MGPRWLETGPRRVQERSKSHALLVLIFVSFWNRLGVVLGLMFGSKIGPQTLTTIDLERVVFDLVIGWSQDGREDRAKRAQEPPGAPQDPHKTLPRGPKTSQELPKDLPRPSKEGSRAPKSGIRSPDLQFWGRLGIRFVEKQVGGISR